MTFHDPPKARGAGAGHGLEMADRMADKGEPVVIVVDPKRILSWGR